MEAATGLDMSLLQSENKFNKLVSIKGQKAVFSRFPENILLILSSLSVFILIIELASSDFDFMLISILALILAGTRLKLNSREIYELTKDGVKVPYLWFLRKEIKFENIVNVYEETITNTINSENYYAIRIVIDTHFLKFNQTGLEDASLVLTENEFTKEHLIQFFKTLENIKKSNPDPPNTLAQRLEDQVLISWNGRWKLILLNLFDSGSELSFYLLNLKILSFYVLNFNLFKASLVIFSLYITLLCIIQFIERPTAIIGIRGNELGPILYNENDVVTNIRLIAITVPNTVILKSCELVYPEDITSQINKLRQIQPPEIEPKKLTHVVAQFLGNHTKAKGVIIDFEYKEREDEDLTYQIPIYWA